MERLKRAIFLHLGQIRVLRHLRAEERREEWKEAAAGPRGGCKKGGSISARILISSPMRCMVYKPITSGFRIPAQFRRSLFRINA